MKSINMKSLITLLATGLFSIWAWAVQPVNVNSANAEEIAEALKGVGMSKAEAIVNYRNENGQFKHVDELVNVKGITGTFKCRQWALDSVLNQYRSSYQVQFISDKFLFLFGL